jgi:hypothetical protein
MLIDDPVWLYTLSGFQVVRAIQLSLALLHDASSAWVLQNFSRPDLRYSSRVIFPFSPHFVSSKLLSVTVWLYVDMASKNGEPFGRGIRKAEKLEKKRW